MFLVCLTLQAGLLIGVPMRPRDVEELMRAMAQPRVVHQLQEEDDAGRNTK